VVDIDLQFGLTDEWYDNVARSKPPKDQPWYRVLVHASSQETYVAERHLEADSSSQPIDHPEVDEFFDAFGDGHYKRVRNLN
jgi:heat shock protein HspQ